MAEQQIAGKKTLPNVGNKAKFFKKQAVSGTQQPQQMQQQRPQQQPPQQQVQSQQQQNPQPQQQQKQPQFKK